MRHVENMITTARGIIESGTGKTKNRLSEKTLELTICSQIGQSTKKNIIWFGLTQTEEARLGFDACAQLNGRLFILQFKASNKDVSEARRFYLNHNQLSTLQKLSMKNIFYVLPLVGNYDDLIMNPYVLKNTFFLELSSIPTSIGKPARKSGYHYLDVYKPGHKKLIKRGSSIGELKRAEETLKMPKRKKSTYFDNPKAIMWSKPTEVKLKNMTELLSILDKGDGLTTFHNDKTNCIFDHVNNFGRGTIGAIVLD